MRGTPSEDEMAGGYINFQAAMLQQLPRPDVIAKEKYEAWLQNKGLLKGALRRTLCVPNAGVWRTVTLGVYKDISAYLEAFRSSGMEIPPREEKLLSNIFINTERFKVPLINVSVGELSDGQRVSMAKLYRLAFEVGLASCPEEVGLALRLEYLDQPESLLVVGTRPLQTFTSVREALFVLYSSPGRKGLGTYIHPDHELHPDQRVVFMDQKYLL
jgi:hypothetical protein